MKILHLIDSGGLYGAEKMLLILMVEQKKSGVNSVLLSCGSEGEAQKAIETEADNLNLSAKCWRMKAGFNIFGMFNILKWAKQEGITHLHSHGYKFNVLIGLIPKMFRKDFHWTVTVHGYVPSSKLSKNGIYNFLDKRYSRRADNLCLVSPAMADYPEFKHAQNKRVILNGISSNRLGTLSANLDTVRATKLLFVGRLSPEKGLSHLIESVEQLVSQGQNIHLTVMGEGPLKQDLLNLVEEKGLNEQVQFKGFVDSPEQFFQQYDVLVMPSLTEGIPITLLEAMREQLIIVASRVGGIPFVLGDNYPYLVDAKNIDDLTEKLKLFLLTSESERQEVQQKNHQRFLSNFTAEQMHQAYLKIYKGNISI